MLRSTIDSHEACAVPAWHSAHGGRLLSLLALPNNEIHIVYARKRLLILRHTLAEIAHSMEHLWTIH